MTQTTETKMTKTAKKVASTPRGFRSITASINTIDVTAAAAFYETVFGAIVTDTLMAPNSDIVLFAQMKIDGTTLMLTLDETALPSAGTGHITLHHYLETIETTLEAALAAGAISISPLGPTWWGDLNAAFVDPFGIRWNIAKRVERLTADERDQRLQDIYRQEDDMPAQTAPMETDADVENTAAGDVTQTGT